MHSSNSKISVAFLVAVTQLISVTFVFGLQIDSDLSEHGTTERQTPNIVLIMADDLGYHDLGSYGHPDIKTPVLDKLAAEGVRLTSFYSGSTVCTPSRMALLTSAYPTRLGWTQGVLGYKIEPDLGMSPSALTIAEVFQANGYATGMSGKWHLGDAAKSLPMGQGFDTALYITKSNNQVKQLWRDGTLIQPEFDNRLLTEQFTTEAVEFIRSCQDKPFLLYVPYSAPHFPVQAHPDWKGKSSFGEYGDVVEELDASVGEILSTLKSLELENNTIVVFLSDNGPQSGQAALAKPYRGLKFSALEGGNRVPCIIRWPGMIPAGEERSQLISALDLFPTLAAACEINFETATSQSHPTDGFNVLDTLTGKSVTSHPRNDLLYWHGLNGFQAIRVGDWKLFLNGKHTELKGANNQPALFNLSSDAAEMNDVSENHAERVSAMTALAQIKLTELRENVIPLEK